MGPNDFSNFHNCGSFKLSWQNTLRIPLESLGRVHNKYSIYSWRTVRWTGAGWLSFGSASQKGGWRRKSQWGTEPRLMEASGPFGLLFTIISVSGRSLLYFPLHLTKVTNPWEEDDTFIKSWKETWCPHDWPWWLPSLALACGRIWVSSQWQSFFQLLLTPTFFRRNTQITYWKW